MRWSALVLGVTINLLAVSVFSQLPNTFDYLRNFDPTILSSPRYAQPINFVGSIPPGYNKSIIVLSKLAGKALAKVQKDLKPYGYSLIVYDAYRPQKAVDFFMEWMKLPEDSITKSLFYPYIDKDMIVPRGYVA